MKLREVTIKNYRCLADITVPIEDTTILVGENNSGKTAFLDAIRAVLPQRLTGRTFSFDEYDYHMCKKSDSPQTSDGIQIDLIFQEDKPDEWPEEIIQALNEIIQTDPINDIDSIRLRLWSKYDATMKQITTKIDFLNINGDTLQGKAANHNNFNKFLAYIRLFYLSAQRNVSEEFSSRSQYWGRILKDLKISEEKQSLLAEELGKMNQALLKEDPRLEKVINALADAQKILSLETGQLTSIQALPLKPWDLMAKSEVVVRGRGGEVDFPLARHGQGTQSLAVMFLFQAYIDVLLKPLFEEETEAILALEELETHLHPQAVRALAASLGKIKSQKIISSHSPFFLQEIPFAQIRMFKRVGPSTEVVYIPRHYSIEVPNNEALGRWCAGNNKFKYEESAGRLLAFDTIEETECQKMMTFFPREPEVHKALKNLRIKTLALLTNKEILDAENYTKRIRGEILFARAWLLCEGQSELLIIKFFADLIGKPLDCCGISVIDFQNNGAPEVFVKLAIAFKIPWLLLCDSDPGGLKFITQVGKIGLSEEELQLKARSLPASDCDLEGYLYANGFAEDYISILIDNSRPTSYKVKIWQVLNESRKDEKLNLQLNYNAETQEFIIAVVENGKKSTLKKDDAGFDKRFAELIVNGVKRDKVRNADKLITKLQAESAKGDRVPKFFADAINDLIAKVV